MGDHAANRVAGNSRRWWHNSALKHWKRGPTIYRELRARGMGDHAANRVAGNSRRWWRNSALDLHIALPNRLFDELGVPRLAA
jgi:RNA-directed DNA polymerase